MRAFTSLVVRLPTARPPLNVDPSKMLEELQYSPRSDKLVLARSRMIETAPSSLPTRRSFVAGSLVVLSVSLFAFASPDYAQTTKTSDAIVVVQALATGQAAEDHSIRPFKVQVPQAGAR